VYIERWEADEPQQDYSNVHVYIRLLPGALESDISIGFDYEFILWSWKNREYMRWWIDQRGYSNINMDVYGLERAAPAFELLANQTLLQDTLSVGFRADVLTMTQEGHHNIYLDLTFVGGYDYATANQTITDVATIFEGMGLEFTHQWNYSTWGSGDITQWYHKNQTEVIVDGITMAGFLDSTTQFENLVTSMYVYDKSAMLVETNVSSLDYISWWMYDEYIGKTSNINFGVDPHHWGNPVLSTDFVQNADSVTTVDLLNPYSLDWSGSIPWNEYSESIELSVHAPFVGSWEEDVSFTPETNNGFAWDSNRWYNNQNSRFHYYVNIYSDQAQIQDYNNGNPVNISALTDISANFSSYFYGDDVDLEAPYIQNLWYHDSEPHGDYLQGYPDYRRIWNSDGIFSGQQDLAVEIKESSETYWNGTTWIERFPSSGIQNATGYFFRSDAPIDHPIFTQVLDFTHNVSWVWDDPNHQIWEGAMDTTQLPDGLWQLWAEVYDNNDNFADSFAGEFEIDNYDDTYTPSVITWAADSPKENEGVGDIVDFNFVVADDAGVYAAIAWNNLGGYFVEPTNSWVENGLLYYNYTFTVDVLAQGIPENAPFTITIEVLDMDGHWSYQEVSVFVDNIPSGDPPTVSLVSPVDGLVINNSLTDTILFAIEAVDDIGIESVDLVISGPNDREFSMFYNEATGYYEYEANIQFWDLGTYTWNVVVTDVDENQHVVEGAASYSLQIIGEDVIETDTEPPVITLLSPADGDEVSEVVTIEVEVTDNDAVSQVSLILPSGVEEEMDRDGNTYSGSWDSASVADGLHTLKVEARDSNGNTAELTFQLKASNGRTASAPQIGLPGFELYLALSAFMVMIPILRRRN
ncbi:MAG: Ig-like domain-containing protein, partial [Candidatus Kariarchaeaceae archaeon]